MKYRELKRCNNLKVSEIALGCEGFMEKSKDEYRDILVRHGRMVNIFEAGMLRRRKRLWKPV